MEVTLSRQDASRPLHYNAPVIEAEAIPYQPALLRGERLLVLAPHPDDEVIGCGGLLAQHLREGRSVRIVVATDGAQGGDAAVRQEESRRALEVLGKLAGSTSTPALKFLGHADRALSDSIAPQLRDELLDFRPDLILVPSPIEIHPDHLSLSRIFCELVQADPSLFADLAVARVAFYEVGQAVRPDTIVDITGVAEAKYAAIAEHASQLAERDYVAYARGLNAYRAMTMPRETKFAEAYCVMDLPLLRTSPFSELRRRVGAPPEIRVQAEAIPISVIVRTKDRPALVREAVESIRATGYPCEIVVVNDGGAPAGLEGVTLVEHEQSMGRAEAGNAGVRAAANPLIAFLDDDDLYYPEHLATLARASSSSHAAWYTDAVSAFLTPGESGRYETTKRLRLYAQDYDRELLLVDNFIPLPALLFRREAFLDLGGFDPHFDLFEDWDFLIRLSRRGDFLRIPRVTCEVRHFQGGSSVILSTPEGSEAFRQARLRVWKKHAGEISEDLFARVWERQKLRLNRGFAELVEQKGQVVALGRDLARLTREKEAVIAQNAEAQNAINGYALRQRELEGAMAVASGIVGNYEHKAIEAERLARQVDQLVRESAEVRAENAELRTEHGLIREEVAAKQKQIELLGGEISQLRVEIARLNGLLDMIYRSRTWKVHTLVEKVRGRG